VKKLNARTPSAVINQRAAAKRARAGRQERGADIVIHGAIKSKRDPFLQKRIDAVVAAAKAREHTEGSHSMDVVRDIHILRFSPSGLKCHKVG